MAKLLPDEAAQLRAKLLRAEVMVVVFAVLAFAGMGAVRWYTKVAAAKAVQCGPTDACRDTYVPHYFGDLICPRVDQRIEAIGTGTGGFFCRCTRSP